MEIVGRIIVALACDRSVLQVSLGDHAWSLLLFFGEGDDASCDRV